MSRCCCWRYQGHNGLGTVLKSKINLLLVHTPVGGAKRLKFPRFGIVLQCLGGSVETDEWWPDGEYYE